MAFNTTSINSKLEWTTLGKKAPEKSKEKLVEAFLSEYQEYGTVDTLSIYDKWITVEKSNAVIELFKAIYNIKQQYQDIAVYYKILNSQIDEIIFSSSPYLKEIYDYIVETFMDYQDLTNRDVNYFYIDKKKLKSTIIDGFDRMY